MLFRFTIVLLFKLNILIFKCLTYKKIGVSAESKIKSSCILQRRCKKYESMQNVSDISHFSVRDY